MGAASSRPGSNRDRLLNATENVSDARSFASSRPTRRCRYRWIAGKCRSKISPNRSGSAFDIEMIWASVSVCRAAPSFTDHWPEGCIRFTRMP